MSASETKTDNEHGWLSRLHSVSGKIGIGFSIVLALHLSIVVLGHYGLNKADADLQTQEELRNRVELFYQIDQAVGELQRNVLLFAFTGYDEQEIRAVKLHQQLDQLLREASSVTSAVSVDWEIIGKMQAHLEKHREIFELVVVDRGNRRQLVDSELKMYGDEFDELVEQLSVSHSDHAALLAAEAAFRFARLQGMEFVHSPDSVHVRKAKNSLKQTREWIDLLARERNVSNKRLYEVVDRYETAFIQMVHATRGYLHLVNVVLAGESQEFSLLASQARRAYVERAVLLTEEMKAANKQFHHSSNLFSIATIVLGVLASWLISRTVAPPLNAITRTFDGLANGHDCDHIPGLGRKDELGKLATAAQIFKDQAANTERLLEQVTRMKEIERQHAHDQKLESLGELAAGIAHEINTPLQCVASNVEFMEEACDSMLAVVDECCNTLKRLDLQSYAELNNISELIASRRFNIARTQVPEALSEASTAVVRVMEIVHAMKSMSHPGTLDLQEADVNEIVRDAATVSRSRWKYCADLILELDDSLPPLMAMSSELSQVMLNLIVNAADAVAENHDDEFLGKIWIRTSQTNDAVTIEVEDTGGGIPEYFLERVFDPFFTTKEVGKGTGQGLSVSYDVIVRRHGGTIDVLSTEGQGATFVITLPVKQAAVAELTEVTV